MKATEAFFFLKPPYRWAGNQHHMLAVPVAELADRVYAAWEKLDRSTAGMMLPTVGLQSEYRTLTGSDAGEDAWHAFRRSVRDAFAAESPTGLAAWFIQFNDPTTIECMCWGDGKRMYLDEDCKMVIG